MPLLTLDKLRPTSPKGLTRHIVSLALATSPLNQAHVDAGAFLAKFRQSLLSRWSPQDLSPYDCVTYELSNIKVIEPHPNFTNSSINNVDNIYKPKHHRHIHTDIRYTQQAEQSILVLPRKWWQRKNILRMQIQYRRRLTIPMLRALMNQARKR